MGEQVCAHTEDAPLLGLRFPAVLLNKLGRPGSGCHSVHGDSKAAPVTPPGQSLGPAKPDPHRFEHDIVQVTDVGQQFLGPLFLEELQSTALAAWFIDTSYNQESFFVRHAYFTGAGDPFKQLSRALKADIDPDAWSQMYTTKSLPFPKPETGKIAVKVINHFGDEVMKVYEVD